MRQSDDKTAGIAPCPPPFPSSSASPTPVPALPLARATLALPLHSPFNRVTLPRLEACQISQFWPPERTLLSPSPLLLLLVFWPSHAHKSRSLLLIILTQKLLLLLFSSICVLSSISYNRNRIRNEIATAGSGGIGERARTFVVS